MANRGYTVKDIAPAEFVKAFSLFLKKSQKLKVPEWVDLVKTGKSKELAPYDADWFYIRCAAVARRVYLRKGVGVGKLRKIYGASKNNGVRPSHHCPGSASVARKALQALEGMKIVAKDDVSGGRKITPQGQRDMDRIARQIREDLWSSNAVGKYFSHSFERMAHSVARGFLCGNSLT